MLEVLGEPYVILSRAQRKHFIPVLSGLYSSLVEVAFHIDRLAYVEPSLHLWNKSDLVIVSYP